MHRWFDCSLIVLLLASLLSAQQKTPPDSKKAAPPEPTFSARLPTEETVNAFMQQMFGHDSSVSWKVLEIKPAEAEGLAEVTVTVSNAQGSKTRSCTSPLMDTTPLWATSFLSARILSTPLVKHSRRELPGRRLVLPTLPSPWLNSAICNVPIANRRSLRLTSFYRRRRTRA